jgi:hypothetical protein
MATLRHSSGSTRDQAVELVESMVDEVLQG